MRGLPPLQGDRTTALQRLETAVALGYADPDSLGTDSDFESLRQDPRFASLVGRAQRNRDG